MKLAGTLLGALVLNAEESLRVLDFILDPLQDPVLRPLEQANRGRALP